jgi:serine-type D-Ala-D-Ala carboxypeptidase/endopeptidase (penicillin-binding protein 4)
MRVLTARAGACAGVLLALGFASAAPATPPAAAQTSPSPPATTTTTTTTTPVTTTTTPVTATTPTTTTTPAATPTTMARATPAVKALRSALTGDLLQAGGAGSALVIDETARTILYSSHPTVARLPASVEKLYTTTTALFKFGPTARLQTSVYGVGTLEPHGLFDGTLYLRGGGDPTFGDATFDQAAYGTGATVQQLVANLRRAGITSVEGRIVGDESYFDSVRGTPATGGQPNLEVEGELSALAYDAGFESAYEDSLQPRPALWATQAFAAALAAGGVKVASNILTYTGRTPPGAKLLAHVSSPTMATLLQLTNAPSDNFFAETLLKDLGAKFGGAGTTAAGANVVRQFVAQHFHLTPRLDDGSGLSRYDRTTAAQVVSLLQQMEGDQPFIDSLAVAGVSGTMQSEMLGSRAVDNCRGKTGTLHDVANLVGYCTAANGDQLIFAFLLNGLSDSDAGHATEDQMGIALADY